MKHLNPDSGEPGGEFLFYLAEDGYTRLQVRMEGETGWLSLKQMTELFQRDKSVISRQIRNVFDENELVRDRVVADFATTAADDVIVSIQSQAKAHYGKRKKVKREER